MITQFSLRLICGMSLMWCCMPRAQVTSGFFRIQMLVTLGLGVLTALTAGSFTTDNPESALVSADLVGILGGLLAGTSFLGSVMWTLERRRAGSVLAFVVAGLSGITLLLSVAQIGVWQTPAGWLLWMSELSTAALLGGSVTGMLLGHWYLTAPTMSIAPLGRLTLFFGVAVVVRLLLSSLSLYLEWDEFAGTTQWVWLSLRWLAGIVGPLAVFVMTWQILKYRNTQAATGVLFVGVILTFIGEMTASLLYQELHVAL